MVTPQVWGHPTCGVCGAMPGAEEAKPGAEEAKPGVEAELQKSYSVQLHDRYIYIYIYIYMYIILYIFRGWHVYICIYIYRYVGMRDDISEDRRYIEKTSWYNPVEGSEIPANSPVEVGSWNPIIFDGFYTSQTVQGFQPSTV